MSLTGHVPLFELIVDSQSSGSRIDSFLTKHFRNYTGWRIQRIVKAGHVLVDSAIATQTTRVFEGQRILARLIEPPDKLLEPEAIPLSIIYEDEWILVVNKPAGIVAHPVGMIQSGTLCHAVQAYLDRKTKFAGILRPGIVHRLDRQTSGAIVVALTHNAHAILSAAFETSQVSKTYVALVEGVIHQDHGMISQPIGRAPTGRHVLMSCQPDAIHAKRAKTQFHVLERFPAHSLIAAKPLTGRNHQIRVHLAHIGFPLVADEFYAAAGKIKPFRTETSDDVICESDLPIRRHALHAHKLGFAHPIGGAWISLTANLPTDFRKTLQQLRETSD